MARQKNRKPRDWSYWILAGLATISFVLGMFGFSQSGEDWTSSAYKSLQMFFMNFELGDNKQVNDLLQISRFGAFATSVWVIIKALFPQAIMHLRRLKRRWSPQCALILGYGPVGQAIGASLNKGNGIGYVTAVHQAITPEHVYRAKLDGVLLIEGDPSDPKLLDFVFAKYSKRIFISEDDDLKSIDTTVAVRRHTQKQEADIRVILRDSAVASHMAEAINNGYLGAANVRWYSLAEETAKQLFADARFDRVALETSQLRMHLVIVGSGRQGEAIAAEALRIGWRTRLGPPKITFLDKNIADVEARLRLRMPAWFLKPDGAALSEDIRPSLEFISCDADQIDFSRDKLIDPLRKGVSGWIFATGDDSLNLRASMALHRAMMSLHLDPAPIHVRIPAGHAEEASELQGDLISITQTFGAVDVVIARSEALRDDPDRIPRQLHKAYSDATVSMSLEKTAERWEELDEPRRNANRALFRHARMKLEDFGFIAKNASGIANLADDKILENLKLVDNALAYDKIEPGEDVLSWLKDGAKLNDEQTKVAIALRDAAICEHARWSADRMLEQFVPTIEPRRELRDLRKRIHNNMFGWYELDDERIRRYDVALLTALLSSRADDASLGARQIQRELVFVPFLQEDNAETIFASKNLADGSSGATHIDVILLTRVVDSIIRQSINSKADTLLSCIGKLEQLPLRVNFRFILIPSPALLEAAAKMAELIKQRYGAEIEIGTSWNWKTADIKSIGFVGHRELAGFGEEKQIEDDIRQCFMRAVVHCSAPRLVTGYAPGADQIAVRAWSSLGLPEPLLVFPYSRKDGTNQVYFTDDPDHNSDLQMYTTKMLALVGLPWAHENRSGHMVQAEEILSRSAALVALVDESRAVIEGGSNDTVRKAVASAKNVYRVPRPS